MTRLAPPPLHTLSPDTAALLSLASSPDGEPLGTIAVLAHRPQLLGPFLGWAAALALEGTLPKRDHELLALRASFRCGSAFEWGEHVAYGRQAGLADDEIERVATGDGWSGSDATLLRAVDELVGGCAISDDTWSELERHYDAAALVEIPYVVGQYTMLSMVANALRIAPVTDAPTLPQ